MNNRRFIKITCINVALCCSRFCIFVPFLTDALSFYQDFQISLVKHKHMHKDTQLLFWCTAVVCLTVTPSLKGLHVP